MAEMFEKDESGFVEDFDPNAEPGEIAAVEADTDDTDASKDVNASNDETVSEDKPEG